VSWKKNKIGVPWKCNSLPGNVRWPLPSGGNIIMHSRRPPNVLGDFWKVILYNGAYYTPELWNRLGHRLHAFLTPTPTLTGWYPTFFYPTNQNSPPKHSFPTFVFLLLPNLAKWSPLEQQHKMDGKHKKKRHL
jgi:hypothetical protein